MLGIVGGSYVVITDSVGTSLTLYTPSGLNGNVYGSAYTVPQGDYSDSWLSSFDCSVACVDVNSLLPDGTKAGSIEAGMEMATADPYEFFSPSLNVVSHAETKILPCVRIRTSSNATLICSTTAPIPTLMNGYMLAPHLKNMFVPVMRNNIIAWEEVVDVDHVGDREIRHIAMADRCFWVGETTDAFILHQNVNTVGSENGI
jgi:hypothetical protein